MREILFRGKRIDNGEQVEGFLVICDDRYFILPKTKINCLNPEWLKKGEYAFCCFIEVRPETIVQYTGLTDKNGKKIFEGDIIRDAFGLNWVIAFENNAFVVKDTFEMKTYFAIYEQWRYDRYSKKYISPSDSFEIIGNIYDNPELLHIT